MKNDTLDQLKKLEEAKKRQLMAKILTRVKKMSKEIIRAKEMCNFFLEQLSLEEKERKSVIDWINSLSDVQLDTNELKSLKEEVKSELSKGKKEAEDKINADTERWLYPQTFPANKTANQTWTTGSMVLCSNNSGIVVS